LEENSACSLPRLHPFNQTFFIYSFAGCRVQVKVKQIIEKADCTTDEWLNVRGRRIINYISTPQLVFYKSADTRDNRHTGLSIADELKAVVNDLGSQKVFALVTDNAANMKAVWSKIEESFHWLCCSCIESAPQGQHGTENNGYTLQESQGNG
jgi:hypothetical protein